MAKAANKTVATKLSVTEFLSKIEDPAKQADSKKLVSLMKKVTGKPAKMWGTAIIGFDQYHYKYESGREGDFMIVGFSPRAANLTLYIMPGFKEFDALRQKLGKYKIGKSCLYIKRLSDIDMKVLEELIAKSVTWMRKKYHAM